MRLKPNTVIHCSKKEEAVQLFAFLKKAGYKLAGSEELNENNTEFKVHDKDTCYRLNEDMTISCGAYNFYQNSPFKKYKIVPFVLLTENGEISMRLIGANALLSTPSASGKETGKENVMEYEANFDVEDNYENTN